MKGKFIAYNNLMRINEHLTDKNNFVTYAVSTTGLDNDEFSEHLPTRVVMQEYVYDKETLTYKKGVCFDKQVECSPEALQYALNNASEYDVFANAGIDVADYVNSTNVLSVGDFINQYNTFIKGLVYNTLFIANNDKHCDRYLGKLDCENEKLIKIQDHFQVLNQIEVTREFFAEKGIYLQAYQNKLENLDYYIKNGEIDLEKSGVIVGTDNRVKAISDFIIHYGREKNLLEKEEVTHYYEEQQEKTEYFVEKGKESYKNSSVNEKLNFLIEKGFVNESMADRNTDCTLNRTYDVLENKTDFKGIIFMQSATTGFKAMNEPIQFSAIAMQFDGADRSFKGKTVMSFDICCSSRAFNKMITEKENNKFDALAYTGIDEDKYRHNISSIKEGAKLYSAEESILEISKFLNDYEGYLIVTNSDITMKSLGKIGNIPFENFEILDFSDISKQYIYETSINGKENALINLDKADGKNFSLETFANEKGLDITNTLNKCMAMAMLLDNIRVKHLESVYGHAEVKAEIKYEHKEKPENITNSQPVTNQPTVNSISETKRSMSEPITQGAEYYDMLNDIYSDELGIDTKTSNNEPEISNASPIEENITVSNEFLESVVNDVSNSEKHLIESNKLDDVEFDIKPDEEIPFIPDIETETKVNESAKPKIEESIEKSVEEPTVKQETVSEPIIHSLSSDLDNSIASLINAINMQSQGISAILLQLQEENRLLREQNATLLNSLTVQVNKSQPSSQEQKAIKIENKSDLSNLKERLHNISTELNAYAEDLKIIDDEGTKSIRKQLRIAQGCSSKSVTMLDAYKQMQNIKGSSYNQVEKVDD